MVYYDWHIIKIILIINLCKIYATLSTTNYNDNYLKNIYIKYCVRVIRPPFFSKKKKKKKKKKKRHICMLKSWQKV